MTDRYSERQLCFACVLSASRRENDFRIRAMEVSGNERELTPQAGTLAEVLGRIDNADAIILRAEENGGYPVGIFAATVFRGSALCEPHLIGITNKTGTTP